MSTSTNTASEIVTGVGGAGNIESLTHCATRLRFQLRDASEVEQGTLEAIDGVMGAVPQAGNRYQIVIGGAVQTVYNEIMALPQMANAGGDAAAIKAAARAKGPRGKNAWLDSLFEYLSDSFRPILGALLGASLFITFMSLMSTLDIIGNWADPRTDLSPSWQFVNLCWQCVFVFLPLMIAYNASKKLDADPWVGFAIMAVLMLPGFTAFMDQATTNTVFGFEVQTIDIFGIPLTVFDYSSQVFPPLLMAAVLGPLYKYLKKIIPENVQLIFVPFLAMLIMIPLTAFIIGPIGVYVGAGLADVLKSINDFSPFIFAIVIPLAYPFMVPLGLHWPINAIMLLNIQTIGYDFIQGPMGAWNFACFGATAGVLLIAWRERDMQMRQTATGALAAGLLGGISEPSLYGIHLRFKRIYPRMLVGCFVGGLIIGIGGGVTTNAFVFTSLLTIPAFDSIVLYGIAVAAAFAVAMILVVLSGYRTAEQQAQFEAARDAGLERAGAIPIDDSAEGVAAAAAAAAVPSGAATAVSTAPAATATAPSTAESAAPTERGVVTEIGAPLEGTVVALSDVPDPVFAKGTMGGGVAIEPSGDTVYAPAAAMVVAAQPTGHAFGLVLDGGIELLIHVGIDTVQLKGEGFDVKVKAGQKVDAGTPLVTFDRAVIERAGYPLITPVVVMNTKKFASVDQIAEGTATVGTPVIAVEAKPRPPA
ncbi:glucose PTS transporter subunit IIA [Gordonia sp. Z-3]|uniref:Glucose PTS transporter subunit IIA n=1 Tax=Gordonia tangerina TaxID=2911060 RepID=A0ABS9DHA5_9ACTN|nr:MULTISPECIES: glucose PTS transporter subunit IIA [Gordonia]MAU81075.1 PTS beta-glucoside transporter subunit EIIBCA [Gordonia sp. (in: high G+C Gram-positive bacteria)]MCF3938396.1 glucose PTS transporter subunit IIA [Gordonia tangerina]MED5801653.1 glucose PTS transporter subunit IIA [Gordonia sp. Z-3]